MRFRLIGAEEAGRFDEFLQSTPSGHIFQSYLWGEVKSPGWIPLRAILENENEQIVAAATVLKKTIPLLKKTIFYLPRGPVLVGWHDARLISCFISNLRKLAGLHKAILIKIDPCIREEETLPVRALQEEGFVQAPGKHEFGGLQPRYTFRLNIEDDLDDIMHNLPKKIRYKIRYGVKRGLNFEHPGEEGLGLFEKVMEETGERGKFVTRNLAYYKKVYRTLVKEDRVDLVIGYYQEEPVTAGITFAFGDKAWAVYGGQTNRHRNLYAYHAMIWERIKWAKSKGASWFDFYGVPGQVREDHPLYGIYHFKKSFGGDYYSFIGEKDLVLSPFYYWLWTRLFSAIRGGLLYLARASRIIWRRSPISGQ